MGNLASQKLVIPKGYEILDSVRGDLDKDSIEELVIVYNTKEEADAKSDHLGFRRELVVYKMQKTTWMKWKSSSNVLRYSDEGGMKGDPMGSIEVKKGVLSISHQGGSRWKWNHTDKYRFRNGEFELIGVDYSYGTPCEYWEMVSFNLTTGKLEYKKEIENCEGENVGIARTERETIQLKGVKINFQNREIDKFKVKLPKLKREFFL